MNCWMQNEKCWMLNELRQPPVFIQLGRYGDLILLLPAWQEIYRRTGTKPIVIVSSDYASVLDGVSYVQPIALPVHWYSGMVEARNFAEQHFGECIVPQWWNSRDMNTPIEQGPTVLQCHGFQWGVDINKWPNFMVSMWERAGFSANEMCMLPLEFDKRDAGREATLIDRFASRRDRPLILYNMVGISSPFPHAALLGRQLSMFVGLCYLVDLGRIKATRIYDLLGLYDIADGLITTDTATLHLAPASKVPVMAFTVDGWCSSVPRGNVVSHIKYSQVPKRQMEIANILRKWCKKMEGVPA